MKNFLLFLMFALFCVPWAANAQETLTVHDGTALNSNVPVHGLWADAYLKCEMVYPQAELVDMVDGTITGMKFYASTPASEAWTGTWQVSLMEVSNATISEFAGPGTVVYEGTLDGTQPEMEIIFTNPYSYEGGNLLVCVYQTVKGNYKSITWTGEEVTGVSVQGYNSSSLDGVSPTQRNFLPKTTFEYEVEDYGCSKPTNLTVSNVTTNSATLVWECETTGYPFDLEYGTDNTFASGTYNDDEVETFSYDFTGLTPGTTYYVRVRTDCDMNLSTWATKSFTTPCEAVTTFPWEEDFESYASGNLTDPCWVNEHIEGSGTQVFKVYTSTNGGNSTHQLQLPDMSSGTMTKLVLPEMNLPENHMFSIDVYRNTNNTSHSEEGIRVYASTDGEIDGATELAFISRNYTISNGVIPAETATGWYTYE